MNAHNVTLLMFDGGANVNLSTSVMNRCAKMLPWGAVKLFLHQRPTVTPECEWHLMPRLDWPRGNACWYLSMMPFLFDTSHALVIQRDGYVIHPEKWQDDWLQWDYIGAPWPEYLIKAGSYEYRTGSGGFQLRSKRLSVATSELYREHPCRLPVDAYECQYLRPHLEQRGLQFAPIGEAIRFAYENPIKEFPNWTVEDSFGFHGAMR